MIQSSENLVTDGQTGESDFIGRCRTNFEQPKKEANNGINQFAYKDNKVTILKS